MPPIQTKGPVTFPPGRPLEGGGQQVTRRSSEVRNEILRIIDSVSERPAGEEPAASHAVGSGGAGPDEYPGLHAFADKQVGQSCVGYVAAKLIEAQYRRANRQVKDELNPEFLWRVAQQRDNTPASPRSGVHDALESAVDYGVPFGATPIDGLELIAEVLEGVSDPPQGFVDRYLAPLLRPDNTLRIASVLTFGPYIEVWKDHLARVGPLAVQLNVTPDIDTMDVTRLLPGTRLPHLIMDGTPNDSHALVVLRYVKQAPLPYFEILNSFGKTWGIDGRAAITEEDAIKFFVRAFGVTLPEVSYR